MVLAVDISSHGYGHLMQIAPVVRAIAGLRPDLDLVVRCDLERGIVRQALGDHILIVPAPADVGLVMSAPHVVDRDATLQAYRDLFADEKKRTAAEAETLRRLGARAVLSDVPFTGLLAAQALGLPSVALCSLHWGEMVRAYLGTSSEALDIARRIEAAYDMARMFLVPSPRRAVSGLARAESVRPLVRYWGRSRREEIISRLGLPMGCRLGLVTFGGISKGAPAIRLPGDDRWQWISTLVPAAGGVGTNAVAASELAPIPVLDILASCDLVMTKTGYGTFMECAFYGVPCVYLARPDWPEAIDLESWMRERGAALPMPAEALADGTWLQAAEAFLAAHGNLPPALPATELGHAEAARRALALLDL